MKQPATPQGSPRVAPRDPSDPATLPTLAWSRWRAAPQAGAAADTQRAGLGVGDSGSTQAQRKEHARWQGILAGARPPWRRRLGAAAAGESEDDGAGRGGGCGYGMGAARRKAAHCAPVRLRLGCPRLGWTHHGHWTVTRGPPAAQTRDVRVRGRPRTMNLSRGHRGSWSVILVFFFSGV